MTRITNSTFSHNKYEFISSPKMRTYASIGVAGVLLISGAATLPFSLIAGASLVLTGAILATAVLVVKVCNRCLNSKSSSLLKGECNNPREIQDKLFSEILAATPEGSEERILCKKGIDEFFTTELNFFKAIDNLTKKNWTIGKSTRKETFLNKLESEGLLSPSKKLSMENDLTEVKEALLDFFALLGMSKGESLEDFNDRLIKQNYEEALRRYLILFSPENMQKNFRCCTNFIKNYIKHQNILTNALSKSEKAKKLKDKFKVKNGKDIFSFFVEPVQRVPRYSLLWNDFTKLIKHKSTSLSFLMNQRMEQFNNLTMEINQAV